jgi:hypothetical protein
VEFVEIRVPLVKPSLTVANLDKNLVDLFLHHCIVVSFRGFVGLISVW